MGKLKSILICCLAICCPFLAGSDTVAGEYLQAVTLASAGVSTSPQPLGEKPEETPQSSTSSSTISTPQQTSSIQTSTSTTSTSSESSPQSSRSTGTSDRSELPANNPVSPVEKKGVVITKNRSESKDNTDYSQFTEHSGSIIRYNFGKFTSGAYITLGSGAQVRNCTDLLNSELEGYSKILPSYDIDLEKPTVLIYHTHSSESFLPSADWYDKNYPLRSADPEKSIVAVGDVICDTLAERGISSVHDCTVHDDPYTGSYYRSAETILRTLQEYPSIKLVIDVHRDGIGSGDGSLAAPVAMIDGKSVAQVMIISCCESELYEIPDYIENFKLACLVQNCAEERYPTFTRPILFDYRSYNQSLSTGGLLIEVGSHGNSLEEALRSGELVGNALADAIYKIVESV